MAECAARYGSGIEGVLAEGIEALISVNKLRGTDFFVDAIGAPKCGNRSVLVENSLYRLKFQTTKRLGTPVQP